MAKNKSLAKNAVFNIIYKVLNIIFPLISATYVARILLPEGVGQVSYAQNIVSYFTFAAALGIPTYGIREISRYRDNQQKTNKIFSELLIINFLSTLLFLVLFLIFLFNFIEGDKTLYIVCGFSLVFCFFNIDWLYQGKEEYVYIAIRSSIIKFCSLILLFLLVRDKSDYIIYAAITCLATGSNHIFNIIHARKYVKFTFSGLELKRHLRPIGYLLVSSLALELYSKVDITMLGIKCEDNVVGFYSNAQKLITLVITLTTAISAIFLPRISYYYKNNREQYNSYVSLGLKIVSFFSLPGCLGIILISDNLTPVMFGEAFMPAATTIQILSLLILIKSLGDILCYQVIISSGNESKLLKSYVLSAIINVILNFLLIPVLKQNGAAVASVISELTVNISLLFTSLKIVHLKFDKKYYLSIVLGTVGMGLSILILNNFLSLNRFAALFIQVFVGISVYVLINLLLKNEMIHMVIDKIRNRSASKNNA